MLKAILFDLSGVLYTGNRAVPGAMEVVDRARTSSLKTAYVTNTSRKTRQQILSDLNKLGFALNAEELITATEVAKQWIQERQLRPWCLVHENIRDEFSDLDQTDPNAVLIGDAAEEFNYQNLNQAFQLCQTGAALVGIGYNRYFKLGNQLLLDAGPFIKAIEFAASVKANIIGKPNAAFFHQILSSISVEPGEALMIGDDVFGDIEGALRAGMQGCLVRTGKYQPGDEQKISGQFHVVDSVVQAVELALNS